MVYVILVYRVIICYVFVLIANISSSGKGFSGSCFKGSGLKDWTSLQALMVVKFVLDVCASPCAETEHIRMPQW